MATMTRKKKKKNAGPTRPNRRQKDAAWKLQPVGRLKILSAPAFARLHWLVHGFSTRPGGASKLGSVHGGKAESALNLGFTNWDTRENVIENRKRFFSAIANTGVRVATMRQIHSDIVRQVSSFQLVAAHEPPQGDALFTCERGICLTVQTADCVPILLADTKHKVIAAIHAGWRGTLQQIAAKTLGRMQMAFGSEPKDVVAAFGPGIGACCYEVGHEVAGEFAAQFPKARAWFEGPFDAIATDDNDPNWLPWLTMKPPGHAPPSPRVRLDLIAANRSILASAGLPEENISISGFCTSCRTDLFFSYRRERTTGRMMAAIGII